MAPATVKFDGLHQAYAPLVRAIVARTLVSRGQSDTAVDDISQRVWTEAWQHLQTGKPITKAWLTLRAQSRTYDHLSANTTGEISLEDLAVVDAESGEEAVPTPEIYVEQPIIRSHPAKEAVATMVETLPPGPRRALELVFYRGLTPGEAATEMGVGASTVRGYLTRGIAALRESILGAEEAA